MIRTMLLVATYVLTLLAAVPAQAQLNGSHTLGDFGVNSGSQPAARLLRGALLPSLRHRHHQGRRRQHGPTRPEQSRAASAISAFAPMVWYVSKAKFLGANYGAMVVLPFANASLEAPAFALGETVDTSFSDMLIRPIDLGWHTKQADFAAGFQVYMPTGRYEQGGERQHREGHVDLRAVRRSDRLLRREEDLQSRHHRLLGVPREEGGHRRQGRTAPHAARRTRQVVPRRRADHRRGVLRPVEAHQGSAGQRSYCPAETRSAWTSRTSTRCSASGRT